MHPSGSRTVAGDRMDVYGLIYAAVKRIPVGKVTTYGDIAALAGFPGRARQVGYALHALESRDDTQDIPWHRVINAQGEISKRSDPRFERLQRILLEEEGVEFDSRGRVSFKEFGWRGRMGMR